MSNVLTEEIIASAQYFSSCFFNPDKRDKYLGDSLISVNIPCSVSRI